MRNRENRRIKKLSNQRQRNVKARIQRLNENSPIFRLMKESDYNFIDHDKGIFQYREVNNSELSNILTNIKNAIHQKNTKVAYSLRPDGSMHFEIAYPNKTDSIYICDTGLKPAIEYILNITFSYASTQLHKSITKGFIGRNRKMVNAKRKPPHISQVSIDREFNRIILETESHSDFVAGVAHINHLLNANPEFTWLDSNTDIEEYKLYKNLSYTANNEIELLMASIEENEYISKGSISIEFRGALAGRVSSMLNKNAGAVNEQLLLLLSRLNRGKRLSELLLEI